MIGKILLEIDKLQDWKFYS